MTDLGSSLVLEDLFFWDIYRKLPRDGVGQYFNLKRVRKLKERHHSLLISWLDFTSK